MSVLTQLTVSGEARPLKIAPEAIYTSSFKHFCHIPVAKCIKNKINKTIIFKTSSNFGLFLNKAGDRYLS